MSNSSVQETIKIVPQRPCRLLDLRELVRYRDLLSSWYGGRLNAPGFRLARTIDYFRTLEPR